MVKIRHRRATIERRRHEPGPALSRHHCRSERTITDRHRFDTELRLFFSISTRPCEAERSGSPLALSRTSARAAPSPADLTWLPQEMAVCKFYNRATADMKPHVPTSVMLEELLKEAPSDHVTVAWLTGSLRERSFGLVLLIMALAGLVPGASTFTGILLGFPAVQMILGRETPGLPRFITSRRVSTRRVVRLFHRAIPLLKRMEKLIRPRWRTPFETTKRIVGIVVLLLAATLVWPFPFSHIIPALVIMLISFAYLEEDGALLCISLAAALSSLAITSATVWAAIRATGLLERLLGVT